jgi:hypothetical protein
MEEINRVKSLRLGSGLVALFILVAFSSIASAQATRTWISGVGDDANPCSRTAPCKTFAGAISKTAPAGEIDCLDPGGFGGVTITKPITLDCQSGVGSILVSGTNGIVINSQGATDSITIRNMTIEGLGTGLDGISILTANTVHIENVKIHNFATFGVQVNGTQSVNLSMNNVTIVGDNATGGGISATTTGGSAMVELNNVRVWNTHPGLQGRANSVWTVHDSDLSFNGVGAKAFEAGVTMNLINCQINDNVTGGVASFGSSTVRVMGSTLSQNGTAFNPNGGTLLSDGLNNVNGNVSIGSTTGSTTKF